jgi:hypothetical protein
LRGHHAFIARIAGGEQHLVQQDVSRDGLTSVLDIILRGQHFGEGCPQGWMKVNTAPKVRLGVLYIE